MSREIPNNATRASVRLVSNQPGQNTLTVNFNLKRPREVEELRSVLETWGNRTTRTNTRVFLDEVIQKADFTVTPIVPKITRQYSVDLNTILYIETLFYNDEPDQTS